MLRSHLEKESFSFIFAVICIILIPVYTRYIPPFMILWAVARIVEIIIIKNSYSFRINQKHYWLMILFIAFFLWQIVSLIYSSNISNGLNILFSRLSLILFPLLLVFPGRRIREKNTLLLRVFAGSTALSILYCFLIALIKSVSLQNGQFVINTHPPEAYWMSYFFGSYLSVNQHPSYMAMYVILSFFITSESFLDYDLSKYKRIIWSLTGILLLISIYFLSSRAGFLVILLSIPIYILCKINRSKKILISILSIIMLSILIYSIIRTNDRIKIAAEQVAEGTIKEKIASDSRILIWKSSINIIKRNVLLGVGIGDVRDQLMQEYELIGDKDLLDSRYNAHNQFLEVFLEGGIIGLMIFVSIISLMTYFAFTEKNILFGLFLFQMFVFFMFETVLYRLAGVSFFSLFSFLLLYYKPDNQET